MLSADSIDCHVNSKKQHPRYIVHGGIVLHLVRSNIVIVRFGGNHYGHKDIAKAENNKIARVLCLYIISSSTHFLLLVSMNRTLFCLFQQTGRDISPQSIFSQASDIIFAL